MKALLVSAAFLLLACSCGSSGGGPTKDAGPGTPTLNVNNFDAWCTVQVNSVALNSTASYNFTPGTVVHLSATANAGFTWGYWLGTDGANAGNGNKDPNMVTTVTTTSSANQTVLACCPSATLKCPNSL